SGVPPSTAIFGCSIRQNWSSTSSSLPTAMPRRHRDREPPANRWRLGYATDVCPIVASAGDCVMITTPLCNLLGIQHPILNASMSETANGRLAAAVSAAGGFGMIGGTNPVGPSWLREQIDLARSLTDRPFGVGFISCFPDVDELVEVALEHRVAAINHSFADPAPYVGPAHAADILVFAMVQTVGMAIDAAAAGVDVIIAQGGEAGGHGGNQGTLALLPAVVDVAGNIPVVAAGGIGDGRGIAAALMLGAQGVWLGTRFVASEEWGGGSYKKDAVVDA